MPSVPNKIEELVERFDRNIDAYKSPAYNETELRVEFVNPFWKALGWDVDNHAGYAMAYRDVIHEDAIKFGGTTKAPDYCFRIGGMRKFFLETKRPALNLKDDAVPAFQLRRYAWSSKLPLSILTDFEEMAVYDCRIRPKNDDKASKARISYLTYIEYIDKWAEIESIFSREAVLNGSFDKYAETTLGKRGTSEVDSEFLKEIENWREILAKNIALRNPALTVRQLNFAVQKTIDRIIFLRMCEDRGIETYGQLLGLCAGKRIYPRLLSIYLRADEKYNSGLFHFADERGRHGEPDKLTPGLKIDDGAFKEILTRLYYPESPYEFSILPPEILGNVYEQFLGKVIRLTAGHRAIIEEKPEVRKAGGVYYTPQYIVDYIVKNTVGKLCENKTPKQISNLRILDPACGSGSFLLSAFQLLLDYHLRYYLKQKDESGKIPDSPQPKGKRKITPAIFEVIAGGWMLTTSEKKRILLNNIFGLDIDSQAVEVTKLSLLLKVLENENQETLKKQLSLWRERALPDLSENIKCGNTLIGPEFYNSGQLNLFDEEEQYRINVFDWNSRTLGFGEIMKSGGFDCVIGNPPYIRIQAMKEWAPVEVEYYKKAYKSAGKGNYDIYVVFVEKSLLLLNDKGLLGFILPHKFFNSQYGEPLREIISQGNHLSEVIHFGDQQVFTGPTTYTCLMFLNKAGSKECRFIKVEDIDDWRVGDAVNGGVCNSNLLSSNEWHFIIGREMSLINKLQKIPLNLGHISHIFVGTQTSADDVFVIRECRIKNNNATGISKSLNKEVLIEKSILKPFLHGKQIRRYGKPYTDSYLICPYNISTNNFRLLSLEEIKQKTPSAYEYLLENKSELSNREKGRFKGDNWHAFGYPKSMILFQKKKIIVPDYNNKPSFTYDLSGHYYKTGYGIILEKNKYSTFYILGLINSPLLFFYLSNTGTSLRGGYVRFWTQYLERLPIRPIDFSKKHDVEKHDSIVELVQKMLGLHEKIQNVKTPEEKTMIERQIAATDNQINSLVYELYKLTDKEIQLVEESS